MKAVFHRRFIAAKQAAPPVACTYDKRNHRVIPFILLMYTYTNCLLKAEHLCLFVNILADLQKLLRF